MKRVLAQQRKLEAEEEQAGDDFLELHKMVELQSQLASAASRLARIRKIRKKTKERSSELLRRGMQELDKEDGVLSVLDDHERWVVSDLQALWGCPTPWTGVPWVLTLV